MGSSIGLTLFSAIFTFARPNVSALEEVGSYNELSEAISSSPTAQPNLIRLTSDILITGGTADTTIAIHNASSLEIDGNSFEINGGLNRRCFDVTNSTLIIRNLRIANCRTTVSLLPVFLYLY